MKTFFLKLLLIALCAGTSASAFSLYDTAPAVGLQESQAARYSASIGVGYDTNPSGSQRNAGQKKQKGSALVNASLSTSYADVESVDKLSYRANLGGTRYLGGSGVNGLVYSANCGANVALTHAFDAMSRYSANLSLSYRPEPGYDNGISSHGLQGDSFTWSFNNSYSSAIDARWSWNAGANTSGTLYEQKANRTDDRQYLSANTGLNYKASELLTYTSSLSYRYESRTYGMDSRSAFANVGISRALDPVSAATFTVGSQVKFMGDETNLYPTLNIGYRRRVSDGLSMNSYLSYSNENIDNYNRRSGSSYKNCPAWRLGAYGTYVLSPDVSFTLNAQFMHTSYSHCTNGTLPNSERYSYSSAASMNYNFSPDVQGRISVEYSHYYDTRAGQSEYNRWQFHTGLSYRF